MTTLLLQFLVTLPALLVSLVFHEVAHGYVAYRLGDPTAEQRGRLSLNPVRHLDAFGTLILFLTFFSSGGQMLFGWAKPVPIDPRRFRSLSIQHGMMLVGLAGPTANFMMAAASALLINYLHRHPAALGAIGYSPYFLKGLLLVFQLNVILMLFNLVPVPPLDGSRVLGGFLPPNLYASWIALDRFGMMFVLLFFFLLIGPLNGVFYQVITAVYSLFLPWI